MTSAKSSSSSLQERSAVISRRSVRLRSSAPTAPSRSCSRYWRTGSAKTNRFHASREPAAPGGGAAADALEQAGDAAIAVGDGADEPRAQDLEDLGEGGRADAEPAVPGDQDPRRVEGARVGLGERELVVDDGANDGVVPGVAAAKIVDRPLRPPGARTGSPRRRGA